MELKLLGLTFRLEVVLICVLLGWVLGAHLFCSCMRVTPYEGIQMAKGSIETMINNAANLDYKMSAGIEVKKKPNANVVGFVEDFQKDYEAVEYKASCSA